MKHTLAILLTALTLTMAAPLHAEPPAATVSKQQAVSIAQQQQPGRVLSVKLSPSSGSGVYRIKMLGDDGSVRIVLVDAGSGEVLSK